MADILIWELSMPKDKDHITITINANGTVQPLMDMYCPIVATAIELPEHGDLISKDDAMNAILGEPPEAHYPLWYAGIVNEIPAIVPSNVE